MMVDYMRNQCPARGPGLAHTLHGVDGDPCRECGTPLTTTPPSSRLPTTASEARRTLPAARDMALREAGVPPMEMQAPEHEDNTPVERRAITGEGPQGTPRGKGRGPLSPREARSVKAHVEYREWLGQHGGGEEK